MVKGKESGFTLIELSIVLVIIGLIVGSVLAGQNLISAAAARAQISQIEKYNTAANTFRDKYGYLPGDIPNPYASQFGFVAPGAYAGEGDGNGNLESNPFNSDGGNSFSTSNFGENATFWVDLSIAHLIDGGFNAANNTTDPGTISGSAIGNYFPAAKIGGGNYIDVYANAIWDNTAGKWVSTGGNYFGLSLVTNITEVGPSATPGITVAQAYSIDQKIDDGLPLTGNVTPTYPSILSSGGIVWANPAISYTPNAGPTTCYDDGPTGDWVNGAPPPVNYSISTNNGAGVNCALSFKMQAGD